MQTHYEDIIQLVAKAQTSEDFIFESIAKNNPDEIFAFPRTVPDLVKSGRDWFEIHRVKLMDFACEAASKEKISDTLSEDLVGAVFAFAADHYGKALAVYVTALALRKLLDGWCSKRSIDET